MSLELFEVLKVVAVASACFPLLAGRTAVRGTTLLGAYRWAWFAVAGWIVVAGAESVRAVPWTTVSHLRYAGAAISVCPIMAVLGARRPGLEAWHFVVLVLLVVLWVPLLQSLLRERRNRPLRLDDVWVLLFAGLLLIGTVNYVATRLAATTCVIGVFQAVVVASVSPWEGVRDSVGVRWGAPLAPVGIAAGIWLGWWNCRSRDRGATRSTWDRVWRDYRERFGLIWSRRVQERFNASAAQLGWPVRLGWNGFVRHGEQESAIETAESLIDVPGPAQTAMRSLLRRFVADPWLAERLEVPPARSDE